MIQWRSELIVSWRTQCYSLLAHGVVALGILIAPWPGTLWPVWTILLAGVIFEGFRSQRRIAAIRGELSITSDGQVYWQQNVYQPLPRPFILTSGILLKLRSPQGRRDMRLWLAKDSMPSAQWRSLRQLLLQWVAEITPEQES